MSGRGHQLIHSDALAAELEALGLDSTLFGAAGVPAPVFANLLPRRAGVWDALPNTFGYGDFSSAFTRASDGLYRDGQGVWRVAGNNVLRPHHDANENFLGVLFEPEEINKCENWNANPDASLTNISLAGPPEAALTRVLDAAALESAGLSQEVCTSGYVYFLDNLAGASSAQALAVGQAGNSNAHTVSVFAKNHASTASNCSVSMNDPAFGSTPFTSTDYARYARSNTPDLATRRLIINAPANSACFFVLNQLEESPVASSPIITQGASATRAVTGCAWPGTDAHGNKFFNQTEGNALLFWRPRYDEADRAGGIQLGLMNIRSAGNLGLCFLNTAGNSAFQTNDGTSTQGLQFTGGLVKDELVLVMVRWSTSANQIQIGYKSAGTTAWSVIGPYDGAYLDDDVFKLYQNPVRPELYGPVFLWNQDIGRDFLQTFVAGFANA